MVTRVTVTFGRYRYDFYVIINLRVTVMVPWVTAITSSTVVETKLLLAYFDTHQFRELDRMDVTVKRVGLCSFILRKKIANDVDQLSKISSQ